MKNSIIAVVVLMILFGVPSPASGDIVELPLDCAGAYDLNSPPWTLDFDLGVTFTDISSVYMDWSGEIIGALVAQQFNPEPFPIDVGIGSYLGSAPNWRHTTSWGGAATYPEPEPFALQSEFQDGTMPWSELFDGQGKITIDYTEAIIGEGYYLEHGSVLLGGATLVVDGIIVPEPVTILLLAVGAVYVRGKYWKRPSQVRDVTEFKK